MQVLNRVRLHRRRHGRASSTVFLGLSAAREGAHALRGDPDSRRALEALIRPGRRPPQLRWSGSALTGDQGWTGRPLRGPSAQTFPDHSLLDRNHSYTMPK